MVEVAALQDLVLDERDRPAHFEVAPEDVIAEARSAKNRGAQFAQEANDALAKLPDSPVRAALSDAIVYVMERRS